MIRKIQRGRMKKVLVLKGRQLGLKTIAKRFKMFWDIRKPYWKGTDEDLIKNIFDDPEFLEPFIESRLASNFSFDKIEKWYA
jgi:hypothetical protein